MTHVGISLVTSILTLAVAGFIVWWALRADRRAKLESTWPTVVGLVSRSEVVAGKTPRPRILYTYTFAGRDFEGKVIQSNMVLYSGSKAPRLLCERFPVGARPAVYVDSNDPKRAVLIPGGDRTFLYFVLALAGFFVLVSAFTVAMTIIIPPT